MVVSRARPARTTSASVPTQRQRTVMTAHSTLMISPHEPARVMKRSEPSSDSSAGACVTNISTEKTNARRPPWYGNAVTKRHTSPRVSAVGVSDSPMPSTGTSKPSIVTGVTMKSA